MKFPVDVPQPVSRYMRINLRRADVGMTEQFLNHPQIRPVFQQMRGEAVP